MAPKSSAEIDTGFPIYGLRFINNHTLLACGGGGEGNNGIPNKVTAVRCSFTVSDKSRRLQKFREITLPSQEDSPMCVEICRNAVEGSSRFLIFIGCNQSTELIRSMNINNNLRKYNYTDDEHFQFLDAVQFDENLLVESIGEYPKIVHMSANASVGGMMTSKIPSEIFIFDPESLNLGLRFKPASPSEIKDFHFNIGDSGKTLTYVTASFIETISTHSGNIISSSSNADKKTAKTLGKYFFSKVRYINESKVIIAAALRNGRGAAMLEYNTDTKRVTKEYIISNKIKGIVAVDVSISSGVFAVAGNDFSVSLLRLSDFKIIKTYTKLHKFAVTCLSFSPDGKKLATGSASNTLNVLLVKPSTGGFFSFVFSLFKFIFISCLMAVLAIYVQKAYESGDIDQYLELSKFYGSKALVHAQYCQKLGFKLSQKYGKQGYDLSQRYGQIGFDFAKEQTHKGVEILKEQIQKRSTPKDSGSTSSDSVLPEWVSETTEITSTEHSDIIEEYTEDVHRFTAVSGDIDTISIINDATQLTMHGSVAQDEEHDLGEKPSVTGSDSPIQASVSDEITDSVSVSLDASSLVKTNEVDLSKINKIESLVSRLEQTTDALDEKYVLFDTIEAGDLDKHDEDSSLKTLSVETSSTLVEKSNVSIESDGISPSTSILALAASSTEQKSNLIVTPSDFEASKETEKPASWSPHLTETAVEPHSVNLSERVVEDTSVASMQIENISKIVDDVRHEQNPQFTSNGLVDSMTKENSDPEPQGVSDDNPKSMKENIIIPNNSDIHDEKEKTENFTTHAHNEPVDFHPQENSVLKSTSLMPSEVSDSLASMIAADDKDLETHTVSASPEQLQENEISSETTLSESAASQINPPVTTGVNTVDDSSIIYDLSILSGSFEEDTFLRSHASLVSQGMDNAMEANSVQETVIESSDQEENSNSTMIKPTPSQPAKSETSVDLLEHRSSSQSEMADLQNKDPEPTHEVEASTSTIVETEPQNGKSSYDFIDTEIPELKESFDIDLEISDSSPIPAHQPSLVNTSDEASTRLTEVESEDLKTSISEAINEGTELAELASSSTIEVDGHEKASNFSTGPAYSVPTKHLDLIQETRVVSADDQKSLQQQLPADHDEL